MLAFKFTCNVLPMHKIKCVDFTHSLHVSATWYDAFLPVKRITDFTGNLAEVYCLKLSLVSFFKIIFPSICGKVNRIT